jgi:hypothetical protein
MNRFFGPREPRPENVREPPSAATGRAPRRASATELQR